MTLPPATWAIAVGVTLLLAVVTVTDLRTRRIPNAVLAPGAVVLGILAYVALPHILFAWDLLAAALLLAAWSRFDLRMGAGDAKLLALMCVALSWPVAAVLLVVAEFAMLVPAAARALRARRTPQPPLALPMAPFLAGAWVALSLGALVLSHAVSL